MIKRIAILTVCLAFILCNSIEAEITKGFITNSNLKYSSYHAYHSLLYWDGDKVTFSAKKLRITLKACVGNKKWAKKMVKKLHLMRYPVKKRVAKIYEYIIDEYEYDSDYEWLEQARKKGRANCSAFADLFYALCKASKVPVRYIMGWAKDGESQGWHCWNKVKIKKKWYWIDCTWGYWLSRKLWKSHGRIIEEW